MKMKHYYAVEWPCGVASHANTGMPYRTVYRFQSKADRAEWIALGGDYRTGPKFREIVARRDVEAEISRVAALNPCGDPWGGCPDNPGEERCY